MAFEFPMIAAGHNNEEGLLKWKDLRQCLFQSYNNFIPREWNTQEAREEGGDQRMKRIGLPWIRYTFPLLYEEDFEYIFNDILDGEEDGPVTINEYDRDNMEWKTFNGTMRLPENRNFDRERGYFLDFELDIIKLREI